MQPRTADHSKFLKRFSAVCLLRGSSYCNSMAGMQRRMSFAGTSSQRPSASTARPARPERRAGSAASACASRGPSSSQARLCVSSVPLSVYTMPMCVLSIAHSLQPAERPHTLRRCLSTASMPCLGAFHAFLLLLRAHISYSECWT